MTERKRSSVSTPHSSSKIESKSIVIHDFMLNYKVKLPLVQPSIVDLCSQFDINMNEVIG